MHIAIVGSGPTGAAAADTLLRRGHAVDMFDVGNSPTSETSATIKRLRELIDSGASADSPEVARIIARTSTQTATLRRALPFGTIDGEAMQKTFLGGDFVWRDAEQIIPVTGAAPPRSVAKGGLSNVWGSACYPLRREDYAGWPITEAELAPHYQAAADLLDLWDHDSGLQAVYPAYATGKRPHSIQSRNPGSPLEAAALRWRESASALSKFGLTGGNSCLATARPDQEHATNPYQCRRCGLCHLGCPFSSIFSASRLTDGWLTRSDYRYLGDRVVIGFGEFRNRVQIHTRLVSGGSEEHTYDRLVLAAGTLSSLRICADSLSSHGSEAPLLDNDLFVVPMVLDKPPEPGWKTSFTLSEAALTLDAGFATKFPAHIQFYSLNDSMIPHPLKWLRRFPSIERLLSHLAIGFIYLHEAESRQATVVPRARPDNLATLEVQITSEQRTDLARRVLRHVRDARTSAGLRPLTQLLRNTPLGFSGHLAGTLPMAGNTGNQPTLYTQADGRLSDTKFVYVVDASVFPSLPAQNPTYSAMANAMRIASNIS